MMHFVRVVFVTIMFASSNSFAGLIETDWKAKDDKLLVFDSESKIEWLKLSQTVGESYNYVESQLNSGGKFEGFRLASLVEVQELISHSGSSWGVCYACPTEIPRLEDLINLIGSGYTYGTGISTWGYLLSTNSSTFFNGALLSVDYAANIKRAVESGGFKNQNSYQNLGAFLVREAQVSEPSTLIILISSLPLLIGFSRTK